jgi:hypothetical protein
VLTVRRDQSLTSDPWKRLSDSTLVSSRSVFASLAFKVRVPADLLFHIIPR